MIEQSSYYTKVPNLFYISLASLTNKLSHQYLLCGNNHSNFIHIMYFI
ncbi:hypothetical protein PPBDW_II0910 [Photobacterium kishitanii]|nr:hypothetical protein PPBDW_II0910 [Photobacterium kishitanii]